MVTASKGVFCILAIIMGVHLGVITLLGRVFRIPLDVVLIASNAGIGGPATAAAMASSKGWTHLIQPALVVGAFGYSIGTMCGLGLAQVLRALV